MIFPGTEWSKAKAVIAVARRDSALVVCMVCELGLFVIPF